MDIYYLFSHFSQFTPSQNSIDQLLWNSAGVGVPAKNQPNHLLMKFWNNPKQSSTNSPTRPPILTIGRTSKIANQSIQGYHDSQAQQVQVFNWIVHRFISNYYLICFLNDIQFWYVKNVQSTVQYYVLLMGYYDQRIYRFGIYKNRRLNLYAACILVHDDP